MVVNKCKTNKKDNIVAEMNMDIQEKPLHSIFVNTAAVVLMIATAFIWGYYA